MVETLFEKIEGIIIRTLDYGETNKIVTLFTKEKGKVAAIARGAKKPRSRMSAVAQQFVHGEFLLQSGSGLGVLQQGEVVNSNRKIREDIIRTAYASYLAELTDKLLDEKTPDLFLYREFNATLLAITEGKDAAIVTMMYELKLYEKAGFAPILDHCVRCSTTTDLSGFSLKNGGVICRSCFMHDEDTMALDEKKIRLLQMFAQVGIERIGNISVKEENVVIMQSLLEAYYEQYGGLYIKSRKFLKQLDLFK